MADARPSLVILAGPNGAGKSTVAPALLHGALAVSGYSVHLVFLWLPSADFAIDRVAERVRAGGHSVPPETVRRRYVAGLRNVFTLYQPLASGWVLYDSSVPVPRPVAEGVESRPPTVYDGLVWAAAQEQAGR